MSGFALSYTANTATTTTQSRSQSHIVTDGHSISKSRCRAGVPSLTRGRICLLYMLLALTRIVFLCSESFGTVTIFYCLRFETPPSWRARSTYLYPPGTGWPSFIPRRWVSFRRLLRLAELQWRYTNPPPRGVQPQLSKSKSKSHCNWRSVNQ
jgi:hypothetical protein